MRQLIALALTVSFAGLVQAGVVRVPVTPTATDLDIDAITIALKAAGHDAGPIVCSDAWHACDVSLPDTSTATGEILAPIFAAVKTRTQKKADEAAAKQALLEKLVSGAVLTDEEKTALVKYLTQK